MRAASAEFRRVMSQRRNFINYADVTLTDPRIPTLELGPHDFRLSGNAINDDIVDGENFSIGTVIGKTVTITIDNTSESFSLYDFYGAVFTLYVGLPLEDDGTRVEKIPIGVFTVITPATTGTLITIEGVDNMYKFDRPYSESHLTYPRTLGNIVEDICNVCGVIPSYSAQHFDQYNLEIATRPEGDFTCRQILSYVAQIACVFAKIDANGQLYFGWMEDTTPEGHADGGNYRTVYKPDGSYYTGDDLDGGTFSYNDGDTFDGGRFNEVMTVHNLGSAKSVQVSTDDVVITGVHVKNGKVGNEEAVDYHVIISPFNQSNAYEVGDVVSIQQGTDQQGNLIYKLYRFTTDHTAGTAWDLLEVVETLDYDITVSDNPFTVGKEEYICNILGTKLIGLKFRPFTLSYLQDPTIESGDWVIVEDIKHNTYKSFVTNVKFVTVGYMSISCKAQSPAKVASTYSSLSASAIVQQNRLTDEKISNYDRAVQRLNSLIANGMGLHTYEWIRADGKIFYMSDKPIEDEDGKPRFTPHSKVWKISSSGFALCTDADLYDTPDPRTGCQWTSGWDSGGNAVYNTLAAIGISFDWARGGTLTLGGDNNVNGILSILDANGRERVRGDNTGIKIGDETDSKIFLDTDGQMQYYFNDEYAGKVRMEMANVGTSEHPDMKDVFSIRDFDRMRFITDDGKAIINAYKTGENGQNGYVGIYADIDNFNDDGDKGVRIDSEFVRIGTSNLLSEGTSEVEISSDKLDISVDTLEINGHNGITADYYTIDALGSVYELHTHLGIVTGKTLATAWGVDSWHRENGQIITILLGAGVTQAVFNQLEQPPQGYFTEEYSFEPHIRCADGVSPPKITDMVINGTTCTVTFTEVTSQQAGSGQVSECRIKLKVIR